MSLIRERLCISALYLFLSLNCFFAQAKKRNAAIFGGHDLSPAVGQAQFLPLFLPTLFFSTQNRPESAAGVSRFCLSLQKPFVFFESSLFPCSIWVAKHIYMYIYYYGRKKGERVLIEIIANIIEPSSLAGRGEE